MYTNKSVERLGRLGEAQEALGVTYLQERLANRSAYIILEAVCKGNLNTIPHALRASRALAIEWTHNTALSINFGLINSSIKLDTNFGKDSLLSIPYDVDYDPSLLEVPTFKANSDILENTRTSAVENAIERTLLTLERGDERLLRISRLPIELTKPHITRIIRAQNGEIGIVPSSVPGISLALSQSIENFNRHFVIHQLGSTSFLTN